MTADRQFWFQIEQVLEELEQLLEHARAHFGRPVDGEGAMQDNLPRWESAPGPKTQKKVLVAKQEGLEPLFGRPLQISEVQTKVPLVQHEAQDAGESAGTSGVLRSRVRERLTWLRGCLREGLSTRDAYLVLFPLVLHADELAAEALGASMEWTPLQIEFFDVDDGGELFFSTLDQVLRAEETLPLILEVYLYCLKDGFLGCYAGDLRKIEEYRERLSARIPKASLSKKPMIDQATTEVELVEFPKRYYIYALGASLSIFVALRLWGALEGAGV